MESVFLCEKRLISMCFNPSKDSIFNLILDQELLELLEEDISKGTILKRFNILKFNDMMITNPEYRRLPKDTYEGYIIYYWELAKKLFLVFPFGYIIIYDYLTTNIVHHFQCTGKLPYLVRNINCSPLQRSIFISAEGMRNVYHINYDQIRPEMKYQKLVIPKEVNVNDLICHPTEKYIFVACSDSLIRIYDYSTFHELPNGLVDINLGKDNKPMKNQIELIKKNNILGVTSIDINTDNTLLIAGNENGSVYVWDVPSSIKDKRELRTKEKLSNNGIISVKFIKTKQFSSLDRFLCLSKEGKLLICNLINVEENKQIKTIINKLYENSIFYNVNHPLFNYNISPSNFLCCSSNSNMICLKWPIMKVEKIKTSVEKTEDYLLFLNFNSKFFFLYDNNYPIINFPLSTQMVQRKYEDYIPITNSNNLIFDKRIFLCDSNFIHCYDIITGKMNKVINYSKEFNLKNVFPLKFEARPKSLNIKETEGSFLIHFENGNYIKSVMFIIIDLSTNVIKSSQKFDDIIDFVILGNSEENIQEVFLLQKNKQIATIFKVNENKRETRNIEGTIMRVYWTPFMMSYVVIYRNILNELKFSANLKDQDYYNYKVYNDLNFRLEYSEREIDLIWQKIDNDKYYLAITMIEKIVITDENLLILYTLKFNLLENLNIISSVFWMGKTIFYTKGNSIVYYYPFDSIEQKIFNSDQNNLILNGLFSDRIIYTASFPPSNNITVFTPPINILEPILIGYLDYTAIDYNLVKEAVIMMFTNQFSQNLIEKLIKKDLKEVCWMLINDSKSSFQNLDLKLSILNDLLKFDLALDLLLPNKNLKNELELDEILWKIHYDQNSEILKNLLFSQFNILINFGQFDLALKFLELLNDFPKAINLLFLASSKEEYEKAKSLFMSKGCFNYSDANLMNNLFFSKTKTVKETKYSKFFDNYKGEPLIFGANYDKIDINSIKDVERKVNKKNSFISNITNKKLSFGETAFQQFVQCYNHDTNSFEINNICSLVIKKFDQFYGYKNTFYEKAQNQPKKVDFSDYNIPLSEMKNNAGQNNENDEIDNSIDPEAEEIQENQYLTAYFHFEKSSGTVINDVTDNNLEGVITCTTINNNMENEENKINDESIWTALLEEFEPIEYEDKWGRKAGGAHAIKFSKSLNTSLKIKHNNSLSHFSKKFTTEFWLKIFTTDVDLLKKDSMKISLQNNHFILVVNNKIIPPVKVKDYQLVCDIWNHLSIQYKRKDGKLRILVNCEEVIHFLTNNLDDLGKKGEIIFGNENLEGEITEIRIWSQVIPFKYLLNNHKAPLPILAECKRKVKMKINKQEEKKKDDKGFGFRNQSFLNTKFSKPKESGYLNQSTFINRGATKNTVLNPPIMNSMAQSQELGNNLYKKENPVTLTKAIPEESNVFDEDPKYPKFTFEASDKNKLEGEDSNFPPNFISVLQQNKDPAINVQPSFNPNDFNF